MQKTKIKERVKNILVYEFYCDVCGEKIVKVKNVAMAILLNLVNLNIVLMLMAGIK